MWETWVLTVSTPRNRWAAFSVLVRPVAMRVRVWVSRGVRVATALAAGVGVAGRVAARWRSAVGKNRVSPRWARRMAARMSSGGVRLRRKPVAPARRALQT